MTESLYHQIEELSNRYSTSLPRYTSYPTAVELRPCSDDQALRKIITDHSQNAKPVSLYLHLPYCPSLCYFCACNKVISRELQDRTKYLSGLTKEISLVRQISRLRLAQIHLGGGSPSYLTSEQLNTLFDVIRKNFELDPAAELSIEVDPRNMTTEKAKTLCELGINRVSMGVQDFDPKVQKIVNRIQSFESTAQTIFDFRKLGINSINLDLIYGLPEQSLAGFKKTIEQVIELRPERIALYGYAHVNWKVKVQNVFRNWDLPAPHLRFQLFELALNALLNAGYIHLGLDHFALPSDELCLAYQRGLLRRNFMGYTTVAGAGILGLGASAISDLSQTLLQNQVSVPDYLVALEQDLLPIGKILVRSQDDTIRSKIIETIMCKADLGFEELYKEFPGQNIEPIISSGLPKLAELQADKLVSVTQEGIRTSELGRFFLRNIASAFDSYLDKYQGGTNTTFSKAI